MSRSRVIALVAGLVLLTAGGAAVYRVTQPLPAPQLALTVPPQLDAAPGTPPGIPLPAAGSLALESDVDGTVASVAADRPAPIGSVAKTMTALVTLEAKPITAGDGPDYVINAHDVDLYRTALAEGGSTVSVTAGERFTERQLLLALMLPSANNLAETLALWVSGDRAAFLARLNAKAVALGMRHTHFDDPAGFSDATVSSAADLVQLGRAVLADRTLAAVVASQSAVLPTGETVRNLDRNLAQPGWLGIKTGSTDAAGGCLLFAAERVPDGGGPPVRVIGALLGQPTLDAVLTSSLAISDAALAGYERVDLAALDLRIHGSVSTPWGAQSGVTAGASGPVPVVLRRGSRLSLEAAAVPLDVPAGAGTAVAQVHGTVGGREVVRYAVRLTTDIPSPGLVWRLVR
jgi:D-alanyl-D-alanine carboxypeptidase (penicillin-binding protein 5/6)